MAQAEVDHVATGVGRAAFIGGVVGFAVFGGLVAGMMLVLGTGAASLGAAVFVGAFSGVGFGSMIGGMLHGSREERR